MFCLRFKESHDFSDNPGRVAVTGTLKQISAWARVVGLIFVSKPQYIYKGYYRDRDGGCYTPDIYSK